MYEGRKTTGTGHGHKLNLFLMRHYMTEHDHHGLGSSCLAAALARATVGELMDEDDGLRVSRMRRDRRADEA